MKKNNIFKIIILILVAVLLFSFVSSLLNKKKDETIEPVIDNTTPVDEKNPFEELTSALSSSYSSSWKLSSNVGVLDLNVLDGVREKRTEILGGGKDVYTIMVYMCAADLESEYGMAVNDLVEMANAVASEKVNVIVYTGGTSKWNTSVLSSDHNQIIKISGNGNISYLVDNAGNGTILDPDTLTSFIEYCANNFEANRYGLILWDHGGGSISGYGYDEKYPNVSPMTLADIDRALTNAEVEFDFVGFDACLMATTETALMLSEHADYLIASEESEPGIGWYYTDWLTKLANNTSMTTLELGKNIADDFVNHCKRDTPGQSATLSVVDLAEVQDVIPDKLSAFASTTTQLIDNDYRTIASARSGSREFASDAYIDMVDLVDMASKIDTNEAFDLTRSLMSAIKYNNTTSDMSNAYGLSIYFPYRTTAYVNSALNVYEQIEMSKDYSNCVRTFASYTGAGQVSSGGYSNPYGSFDSYDYTDVYSNQSDAELIYNMLEQLMSGYYSDDSGYDDYYSYYFDTWFDRSKANSISKYIANNHFDADLNWKDNKITLTDKQWAMVDTLRLNVFIDDGEGYIDLGKDAVFTIDPEGSLLMPEDKYWLGASVDNENYQVIPYYHLYQTVYDDRIVYTGRIPALLNGYYVNLITEIDDNGSRVIGATRDYREGVKLVAKNITEIKEGDEIQFVCDYYDYDGNLNNTFTLGDKLVVKDDIYIADIDISEYNLLSSYEFVDIYQKAYYSSAVR